MAQKKIKARRRKEYGSQELMVAIGAPYYDPMAPEQHSAWRTAPGSTPLMRMWSVMNGCTIAYGRRCPFAIDEFGDPLDIKGLAFLCEMDLAYTYLTWKKGVEVGFWRDKTEEDQEGELFLCGTVRPAEVPEEEPPNQDENHCVYTQFPDAVRKRLKDYQLNDLAKLPECTQLNFLNRFNRDVHIELGAHAEVTAALRLIMDPRHDRTFDEFGIKKIREVHKRSDLTPEQVEARKKRIKALARRLKLFVDTIESEYTPAEVVYAPQNGSVQSPAARPSFNTEAETEKKSTAAASGNTRRTPPPVFHDRLDQLLNEHRKGVLTASQYALIASEISEDLRDEFLQWLSANISGFRHAGGVAKSAPTQFLRKRELDAGKAAVEDKQVREKRERRTEQQRREMKAILADPKSTASEKELARIALGEQASGGGAD